MRHKLIKALLAVFVGTVAANGWAGEAERNWGLSPYLGLYHPSLEQLNKAEFYSPYGGSADLVDRFGNNNNVSVPFLFLLNMPEMDPGALTGLEFRWRLNDRHALLIGGGAWQSTSRAATAGFFPIQGAFESVLAQRQGDISFTEFYLGWRYNAVHKPKDRDFYFLLSLHEIFDVNYREDFSLLFLSGPPRSFRRSLVIETSATGLLIVEGGGGGEWFLNDWLSLGVEAGYGFGLKALRLGNGLATTDFGDNDNLSLDAPLREGTSKYIQFKDAEDGRYRDLRLNFSGWKALLKFTIYY